MNEAIFIEGLTKSYDGKTVVNHLSLSVPSGTVFGLLGANGAGKSTTIECMLGTKQADEGTVRLLGQDPKKHRRTLFQRIGVQFQEGDYQREIRVSELCDETASLYRTPADWCALCEQFGIGDKANTAVKDLSGGERQRLFKDVKQASVIASILYFPMLIFSGTTLPIEVMPPMMQKIVSFFPMTQGITMMKNAFLGNSLENILLPIGVMLGLTAVCAILATRFFRWE